MIVTKLKNDIKIPIIIELGDNDVLVLSRTNETIQLPFVVLNEFYIKTTIPEDITLGEWNYKIGGNDGLIQIEKCNNSIIEYENSIEIMEYEPKEDL